MAHVSQLATFCAFAAAGVGGIVVYGFATKKDATEKLMAVSWEHFMSLIVVVAVV